ncbi:hypothetical protein HPB51_001655 [Rhipicephalus microplus]|uniref:Uncharacterized protein n=1 Tax=Rhipicephalus microplus TaxID=6941 RepID=A0A9J6EVW5_RHIMP|nr:hypothetical protein HPB51_001655 [Rhipicephalus microplus]
MYAYNLGRTGAPDVANYTRRRQIQRVLQSASSAKAHICRGPGSEGVDHSLRGASTKRSEPHAGQRKGQSKSSDQPTWADKLKTPNGTRPPATNTPPAPDPRDQELRALRVEVSRLTTLLTQSPTPPSPPSQQLSPEKVTPPTAQSPNSPATHSSHPLKKKRSSDSVDDYQADLRNLEAKFDAKLVALEARIEAKFATIVEQLSTRF